jgi:hypothetical protein
MSARTKVVLLIEKHTDLYSEAELRNFTYSQLYKIFRDELFASLYKKINKSTLLLLLITKVFFLTSNNINCVIL